MKLLAFIFVQPSYHKQKSWKVIEIYSELLKTLNAGILSEDTLLGAEHLSQKALILLS